MNRRHTTHDIKNEKKSKYLIHSQQTTDTDHRVIIDNNYDLIHYLNSMHS